MLCPKCQKENLEGAKFCAFCGTPFEASNVQLNIQPSTSVPIPPEVSAVENDKVAKVNDLKISLPQTSNFFKIHLYPKYYFCLIGAFVKYCSKATMR